MALKATELRIGNYIRVGGNSIDTYQTLKPYKVTAELIKEIEEENEERPDAFLSVWMPIVLTPEILIKLDFKEDGYEDVKWYQKSFPIIGELCTSDGTNGDYLFDTETDKLRIRNLHTLQNLYFSLTGEELPINL